MFMRSPLSFVRNLVWILRFARMRKKLRFHLNKQTSDDIANNSAHQFFELSVDLFQQELNRSRRESKYLLKKHIYDEWISVLADIPLRAGMRLLLGELRRNNIALGILSDFQAEEKIQAWKLDCYFDTIICAENYGMLKPNPRLFHKICEQMRVSPEEVVFVGNHLAYDGIGARKVGMHTLLFHMPWPKARAHSHNISMFMSMFSLRKHLKKFGVLELFI